MRPANLRRTHTPMYVRRKRHPILDVINQLLNVALSTANVETLLVREQHKTQALRPQLHVLLQSRPGALKTTILEDIGRAYNVTPCSYATYAAMIGSIDRITGQVIPGLVWETRRKPLLLDEFRTGERGDAGALDVLLGALESGHYKRRIAVRCQPFEEADGSLYYRARNGEIEVHTSFPCIIATMKKLEMSRSDKVEALLSRCIPIKYELPDDVVDDALQGARLYHAERLKPRRNVVIGKRDYDTIIGTTSELRNKHKKLRENYARAVGDLCRIFAVFGRHDEKLYRLVCFLKSGHSIEDALKFDGGE